MNADQFATEIKRLRDAIDNSTCEGELLCDELACRPDIAEALTEMASVLRTVAGLAQIVVVDLFADIDFMVDVDEPVALK